MTVTSLHRDTFVFPPTWRVTFVEPQPATPLPDLAAAVQEALDHPLDSPPLRELAHPGDQVVIAFPDATRASPDHVFVPALLAELSYAGVRERDVTLLCAVGMHRRSTDEEKAAKLGEEVLTRYRVVDHDPYDVIHLGELEGIPLVVSRHLLEADLVIATGIVEPHQYAGYSGGSKTVVIGCGGEGTITATHCPAFLDRPGVRLGQVEGNPFQAFLRRGGERVGLRFVLNAVVDPEGRAVAVRAGHPESVHDGLVTIARFLYEVPVERQFDVVIAGVDPPKDVNLYQASRAATYIALSSAPALRPGGFIILPARIPEGAGQGVGERRFFRTLARRRSLQQLLDEILEGPCLAGEQRAYMVARTLLDHPIIVVGAEHPEVVEACHMTPAATMEEAFEIVRDWLGDHLEVLVVPHALHTIPVAPRREPSWASLAFP